MFTLTSFNQVQNIIFERKRRKESLEEKAKPPPNNHNSLFSKEMFSPVEL